MWVGWDVQLDRMCRCRGVGRVRHSRLKPAARPGQGPGSGPTLPVELHVPASNGIRSASVQPIPRASAAIVVDHTGGCCDGAGFVLVAVGSVPICRTSTPAGILGLVVPSGIGSGAAGTSGHPLDVGSSGQVVLAAVRTGGRRRIPRSGRAGHGGRARDRTWWEGLGQDMVGRAWDRTWWEGLGQDVVAGAWDRTCGRGLGQDVVAGALVLRVSAHRQLSQVTGSGSGLRPGRGRPATTHTMSRRPAISCLHPRARCPRPAWLTHAQGDPATPGQLMTGSAGAHSGRQLSCRSSAWCST